MSSHASPERVSAIRHLGVEHYLIKPVPIAILTQAIRTELDRP
jgi:response regulator of citrate/malate metabolism